MVEHAIVAFCVSADHALTEINVRAQGTSPFDADIREAVRDAKRLLLDITSAAELKADTSRNEHFGSGDMERQATSGEIKVKRKLKAAERKDKGGTYCF